MKPIKYFELSRLGLLFKMEICRNKKGLLMTLFVLLGLNLTGFILENIFSNTRVYSSHNSGFVFFMLIGGFIVSSFAFNDLSNPLKRLHYLTLPATTFEKTLSMWLLTCITWIIIFTLSYIAFSFITNAIGSAIFSKVTFYAFDPLSSKAINGIKFYIVLQSVFLAAAVHFRGYVFIKTLFTILVFAIVCGIVFYFLMADLFSSNMDTLDNFNPMDDKSFNQLWQVIKYLFWWVLAPISWVVTFLGLKEQEV